MKRRLLVGLSTVAAAGAVLLPATAAQAYQLCPANSQRSYAWYSNAAHTTQVGGRTIDCQRVSQMWGTQTAYLVYSSQPC